MMNYQTKLNEILANEGWEKLLDSPPSYKPDGPGPSGMLVLAYQLLDKNLPTYSADTVDGYPSGCVIPAIVVT